MLEAASDTRAACKRTGKGIPSGCAMLSTMRVIQAATSVAAGLEMTNWS